MATAATASAFDLLPEVLAFRSRFPIFKTKVHLANNAMGAVCDVTAAANRQYLDDRIEHGASWEVALAQHDMLRDSFAELIGAKPHEIAVCFTATQALGVLASCFDWKDRSTVVFDDYSFPSVAQLWHGLAPRGVQVRRVAVDDDGLILPDYFDAQLDEDVQIVSVSHLCYKNGHLLDIAEVAKKAHAVGALFVVDAYQSCGSRAIDVKAMNVDVLVAGTVKYMLGGPGVTLMYVREELHDRLHPTITGWFAQVNPNEMQIHEHQEAPDAGKFQSGTPSLGAIYESVAGLALLKSIGVKKVERWIAALTAYLVERLHDEDFMIATPHDPARRGPQIAIRAHDAAAAVAELAKRGITSSHRDNNVRTAWHFYNTPDDVDALVAALKEIQPLMRGAQR